MRHHIIVAVLLLPVFGFSQVRAPLRPHEEEKVQEVVEGDAEWSEGTILDNDNNELKGQLKFNDRTGIVSFESGRKSGSYGPRNLQGFDFFDQHAGYQRYFFSLPYESDNGTVNHFFELIRQYKEFAVIIKSDPVDIRRKRNVLDYSPLPATADATRTNTIVYRTIVDQVTTMYFLRDDMTVIPFLEITDRDLAKTGKWSFLDGSRTKVKVLDKDLPKRLMGDKYPKVKEFADSRNMKWSDNDDIVSLLDYYDALVND